MDSLHSSCLYSAQEEETTEAVTSLPAKVIASPFPLVLKKGLILAEVKPQPEVCGLCHMQNSVFIFTLPRSTEMQNFPSRAPSCPPAPSPALSRRCQAGRGCTRGCF